MNEDQDVKASPEASLESPEDTEQTVTPVADTPNPPIRKRPLRLFIVALIAAVIVVLIGGSVFGYTMWYQNPDKVVHDAVLNAIKAETAMVKGTVTYTGDDFKMELALDSKSTGTKADFTVAAKVTINSGDTQQNISATGTGRVIDDTLYVKVNGVKDIVEDTAQQSGGQIPEYAASIFEKIENRWISIEASDYDEVSQDIATQQTCFLDLIKRAESDSSMSSEVVNLYRDNQILVVNEELGSKEVNGVNSFGFKVSIDKNAANGFVAGLEETEFGKEMKKCNDDIDFKEITDDIDQEASEDKDTPVTELWISQFGHEITELAVYGSTSGTDELNIKLQPTFNENVTVDVPENATSLRTVLQEIQQTITEYYSETYPSEDVPSDLESDVQLQAAT